MEVSNLPVQFQELVGLAAPKLQGVIGVEDVLFGFMFRVFFGDSTVLDYSEYTEHMVVIEVPGLYFANSPVIRQEF